MFSSLAYFLAETTKSLFRNRFMTMASILTVTLSMFILGTFLCVVLNINHMASYLEDQVEMSVYMKDGLTTSQVMDIGKKLKALPELKEIKFTNKDQANGNPLPASYRISFSNPEALKKSVDIVKKYPGVDGVQYGQDIIEQLYKIAQIIRISGIILMGFLAAAELFIISNTIRLTVFARRREIQIMKYVGATNGFIRWPFIFEGIVIGFIGSVIASIILWQGYQYVVNAIFNAGLVFVPTINVFPFMFYVAGIIILFGIIIGVLGSAISLRKYMKV